MKLKYLDEIMQYNRLEHEDNTARRRKLELTGKQAMHITRRDYHSRTAIKPRALYTVNCLIWKLATKKLKSKMQYSGIWSNSIKE